MGRAFKCDRCGQLFEKQGLYEKPKAVIMIRDKQDKLTGMDICQNCQKRFMDWWQNVSH